ncbi:MAG: secretin N-terminal domain-containing protein [Terriglobia bacterium]
MFGRRFRLAGVLGALALWLSCGGGGSVAFKEGRKAEYRKDWDSALVNYEKAVQSDPANAAYVLHDRQARTEASLFHLKNGRLLVKGGRAEEASGEFQKAARIDPSNEAAAQELARILTTQAEAKRAREAVIQQALKSRAETGQPPTVQLQPFPTEPLAHFRISADSRKIIETLGKLAGLNVVFTPDFRPNPLSVDLTNIKVEDALRVVALQTKSFWRALTPNTILVIPDDPNHRRDYDEEVLKTIYLSNPLAPADRTAITTALKQVLGLQRIMDNPDSNAIIIRDTPAKVAAAEQLVRDLDRAKAEILVEVDVVEADRDRIRDLGLTPATVSSTGTITAGLQAGAIFSPSSASSSSTASSLVNLGQLTYRDYAAVLPSATASAVLNDSKTHILQSPEVRVTDGQTAKLRIGSRIPYATGSFLPSFGGTTSSTSGIGLLASTQFQYQDVGVNLELTPRLLATGEVALHAKIEISSLGASISVGGFSQPTFGQRVIEHDIRLREGEVNLLGGLIQNTVTSSVTGVPGLGDVPLLRYFFSQVHKEVNDTEVLVMLTPRVIRLPEPAVTVGTNLPVGGGGGAGRPGVPEPQQPPEVPPESPPEPPGQPQ